MSLCFIFPPLQGTESTSAQLPAPPGPEGPGPSTDAIDTKASLEAGSGPAGAVPGGKSEEQGGGGGSSGSGSEEEEAEVVEELPLPELYVPGRIVHIYRQGEGTGGEGDVWCGRSCCGMIGACCCGSQQATTPSSLTASLP